MTLTLIPVEVPKVLVHQDSVILSVTTAKGKISILLPANHAVVVHARLGLAARDAVRYRKPPLIRWKI